MTVKKSNGENKFKTLLEKRQELDNTEKRLIVKLDGYKCPQVEFIGEWDGIALKSTLKEIQKSYRQRRHKLIGTRKMEEGDDRRE